MTINYNIEDFKAVNDRVILIPGPLRTVTYETEIPDKTKGKKDHKTGIVTYETKKSTEDLISHLRIGKIVSISERTNEQNLGFTEGDWVIYRDVQSQMFDLMANRQEDKECPIVVRGFDIIAKLNESGINTINKLNNGE